jgi:hypothetical protein
MYTCGVTVQIPFVFCFLFNFDHFDRDKSAIRPPHGKCKKRPALLGEVSGGRAIATTRLYPALF